MTRFVRVLAALLLLAGMTALPAASGQEGATGYVGVYKLAEELQLAMFFDDLSNRLTLVSEDAEAVVTPGLDVATLDSRSVKLDGRVRLKKGEVQIPESFALRLKKQIEQKRAERKKKERALLAKGKKLKRIVLDPGHGGRFPGACAHGLEEKEINLSVARKLKRLLEDQGIEVLMTRTRDTELSEDLSTDLDLRCDFTNSKRADLFVSIHANAGPPSATGFEVFIPRPEYELDKRTAKAARRAPLEGEMVEGEIKKGAGLDTMAWRMLLQEYYTQSKSLAQRICQGLSMHIDDNNRGVFNHREFRVITYTHCPAVLVEMGFMSNRATARKLATDSYRTSIAKGIAKGILEFKKEYDRTDGFTKSGEAASTVRTGGSADPESTSGSSRE
jgi:N-acetylmuramoyl-L-alanine amidase